jgi:eukaryotic-like serine/threonine-protein kinase
MSLTGKSGFFFAVLLVLYLSAFGCVEDIESDGDGDSDVDSDVDSDSDSDVIIPNECPNDMVRVTESYCIDRYESSQGSGDIPLSVPNVMPWVNITFDEAVNACRRAGKFLCYPNEFRLACSGPDFLVEPEDEHCNTVEGGMASELVLTGSFPDCEGYAPGVYDLIGNASEWVFRCHTTYDENCEIAGGSYTSANNSCSSGHFDESRHYRGDRLGFRCCLGL